MATSQDFGSKIMIFDRSPKETKQVKIDENNLIFIGKYLKDYEVFKGKTIRKHYIISLMIMPIIQ